ncbi:hypothetical protein [Corynebacterium comes]|uniref:hypothetical protein n=1 Tax=Corynebacterium comes TaxID=2675218 RepID=UPI0012E1EBBB|nr:hypothetical protein [Corynebacterium comes]
MPRTKGDSSIGVAEKRVCDSSRPWVEVGRLGLESHHQPYLFPENGHFITPHGAMTGAQHGFAPDLFLWYDVSSNGLRAFIAHR